MKRKIAFVLAMLMTLVSLAGCGKKELEGVSTGAEVKLNGKEIYPIQCDDTLTYWFEATAVWSQKYENFAETPVGKEVAEKSGVKVEYIHPAQGQGTEQFQIMLASDELPDIVNYNWFKYPGGPEMAITDEYIYALSDIVDAYCPSFSKLLSEHPEYVKDLKTDNGTMYAFPSFANEEVQLVAYGPILRGDWLEELGLEVPRNIADWEKVLKAFKGKGEDTIPYLGSTANLMETFAPGFGTYPGWYQDNGEVKFGQMQPQYKDFLAKMRDWYAEGLIYEDFFSLPTDILRKNMINGFAGSNSAWLGGDMGLYLQTNEGVEPYTLVATQYPAVSGSGNAEYSYIGSKVSIDGTTTAISKNCKNVELAARFLDFGYSEVGHNTYNFGVEGENYNWVDKDGEKFPQFNDIVYNNPDGLSTSDVLHMYTRAAHANVPMRSDVRFMTQFYPYQEQVDAKVEWAKTNMISHKLPPIYVDEANSDTDADIMAAVNTYVSEMTIKFILGRESLDKFDEYIETIKSMGIDKSIGFRQDALEKYNNRK